MIKRTVYLAVLLAAWLGHSSPAAAQGPPHVVPFSVLDSLMHDTSRTIHVINFWATWCKPCVEEMPGFQKLQQEYAAKGVKLVLVSLDSPKKIESSLMPFLKRTRINPNSVWVLNAGDPNKWIDKVSTEWQGSIPATLVIQGSSHTRQFFEQQLTYEALQTIVQPLILP